MCATFLTLSTIRVSKPNVKRNSLLVTVLLTRKYERERSVHSYEVQNNEDTLFIRTSDLTK